MITCAHCHKQITRKHPKYCFRCGHRIFRTAPAPFAPSAAPQSPVSRIATPSPTAAAVSSSKSVPTVAPERTPTDEFNALMDEVATLPQETQAEVMSQISKLLAAADAFQNAPEDSGPEDGLSGGLLDLVVEDELTEEERITNEARIAKRAAYRRAEGRANRRGIALGAAIGIGLLGLLRSARIGIRVLPFVRFGSHHWITLTQPATAGRWGWEIGGTLLMLCSLVALSRTRYDGIHGWSHPFRRAFILTVGAIMTYAFGAICLGAGR
jgi:hypothetical protein